MAFVGGNTRTSRGIANMDSLYFSLSSPEPLHHITPNGPLVFWETMFLSSLCCLFQEIASQYRLKPAFFLDNATKFDVIQGDLGKSEIEDF